MKLISTFTIKIGICFALFSAVGKSAQEESARLEKANHLKGWDAKPLALNRGMERQQGCRAGAALLLSASRSVWMYFNGGVVLSVLFQVLNLAIQCFSSQFNLLFRLPYRFKVQG